jgi:hypothetical protein
LAGLTSFTLSAWVKADTLGFTTDIFSIYDEASRGWLWRIKDVRSMVFFSAGHGDTGGGAQLNAGTLYHVAMSHDRSTRALRFYINGQLTHSATHFATFNMPNVGDPVLIGRDNYDGGIFDVRVYNYVKSDLEVMALWLPQTRWELYATILPPPYYKVPTATIIDPGTASTPYPYILRDRAPLRARYRATLYSPQGTPQALITGYSQLSYTLTTSSDGGGFSIALPPTMDRSLIKDGSFVTIDRTLDGGIPHFEDCYIVLSTPEAQAKKGTRFPTIEGPSVTGYVTGKDFRAIGQLDSTLGSYVTSVPADDAVKYFVSRNMAAGAENNTFGDTADRRGRDISKFIGFTVEKDRSLGPSITYNASLKALDVAIRDIAKLSEENANTPARLFWYVKPKSFNPLAFEFVTFLGKLPSAARPKVQRGAFNTYRGFDSAAPVILGPAFGTVIETDGEHDLRESFNSSVFTYNSKGSLSRVTDKTRAAEFAMAFRERLGDAKDSGTETEGKAEMRSALNDGRPRLVTRFRIADSLAVAYGRDYFLGDILGCLALDRRFEAEVSGIEVNQSRDGDTVTVKVEEILPFTL